MNRRRVTGLLLSAAILAASHPSPTPALAHHTGTPTNRSFETPGGPVGTPPANYDFATGDLTSWNPVIGTASVTSGGPSSSGKYALLGNGGSGLGSITSAAFTVDANAQVMSLQRLWLGEGVTNYLFVYVLYGPTYSSSWGVHNANCNPCASGWQPIDFGVRQWQGQSIKIKVTGYGLVGVADVGPARIELASWVHATTANTYAYRYTGGPTGAYAYVPEGGLGADFKSDWYLLDPYAKTVSFRYTFFEDDPSNQLRVYLAKAGDSLFTPMATIDSATAVPWTEHVIDLAPSWQGALVRMRFRVTVGSGPVGFDDVGSLSEVELHFNTGVLDANEKACVGPAGRHSDSYGVAYDLFADGNGGGCGDIYGVTKPVDLRVMGLAGYYFKSLQMTFVVEQISGCDWVKGIGWDAFSGAPRGEYRWLHLTSPGVPAKDLYAGTWQANQQSLGDLVYDSDCSPEFVGFHVHQTIMSVSSGTTGEVHPTLAVGELVDPFNWGQWMHRWIYRQ